MSVPWYTEAVFYHIYPLGFCGAPERNAFQSPPVERLLKINTWLPHLRQMGVNALYLGPVFESESHGYNTVNFQMVDRRLGTRETLHRVVAECHANDIRIVLDGVFNHVGRAFFAFQDLQHHQQQSQFKDWFVGVNFQQRSPYHDPFSYQGWNGHASLVKLNPHHPPVVEHLFQAVRQWVTDYQIDGLRLDTADVLDFGFMRQLAIVTRQLKPDFWLMGEVIHGDYTRWVNPEMLHATTNYECYKGLYSSHNDKNYFEIAYALNRQFGEEYGLYKRLYLYNFADNHDVNRVASMLHNPAHLTPLYLILLTMPGIPSIYYGSEWGLLGKKTPQTDRPLRPELQLTEMDQQPQAALCEFLSRLIHLRRTSPALQHGRYQQLHVASEQFAFLRAHPQENVVVAVNASQQPVMIRFPLNVPGQRLYDRLHPPHTAPVQHGQVTIELPACGGRVLHVQI
jgi:cyclomaltodextrinase / maltogenic alpha-amylase / neopullulanase